MKLSNVSFFYWFLITTLGSLLLVFAINYTIDIYGLYASVKGESKKVYYNERKSKLLLSKNYIPTNYNTILIGPSLSDNINVSYFSDEELSIYNASMMGAKINELVPIVKNFVEKGGQNIIICLHPYLTDSYKELDSQEKNNYMIVLGSLDLYRSYLLMLLDGTSVKNKISKNDIDQYGFNNYYSFLKVADVKKKIEEEAALHQDEEIKVGPKALTSLETILLFLKKNNVRCMGYFHPIPEGIYNKNKQNYANFQHSIQSVFEKSKMKTIDFNTPKFKDFTSNYNNYIDHGHLSEMGQKELFETVLNEFQEVCH
ncbi:hypothetical protein R9C00_29550 (plasmid) [Flammeovirgaceae bacterium SG7u.111]|nr:hypothetical protein [Flammeovirgaceae bacterium SG7u.132]WPO38831.1 hypothetical protein R9C00_29550 [Flammeovirgaceae bacterium SG7u.111]